ncbi:hypothetical protein CFP56_041331 [Quercus suber]|uniref:Uncharacterized protein n=1 Tax=Quercus suber TaxID=58331 RepID=A0AAW0IWF3_QUESU
MLSMPSPSELQSL